MDQVPIYTAFVAGLVSFLSPCVLPLVPGYISIISGSSLDQLKAHEKDSSLFRTVLMNSIMFIIGFSITFILLGASATWIGQVLASRMRLFGQLAGLILIVFGIHLTGLIETIHRIEAIALKICRMIGDPYGSVIRGKAIEVPTQPA